MSKLKNKQIPIPLPSIDFLVGLLVVLLLISSKLGVIAGIVMYITLLIIFIKLTVEAREKI
jgi:hypothetical protein